MIVLFEKKEQDYSTNGLLVMDKYVEEAKVSEEINGEYELEVMLLQDAKLTGITNGMILRVPVPIRETPAINMYETVGNEIWKVKGTNGLRLRTGPGTDSKTLASYKRNAEVIVVEKTNTSWYKVVTKDGKSGYMSTEFLEYVRTEYQPPIFTGAVAPGRTKDQLFRICNVGPGFDGKTIKARHIFYDLRKNHIITASTQNVNGALALQRVLSSTVAAHDFHVFSDSMKTGSAEADRKNPVDAILGEGGIIETYGGEILRDNFDIYHAEHVGYDRGVSIAYRKNMTGFRAEFDDTNVYTRIIPVGLNADDTPLYIDGTWVDSPHIEDYEGPRIKELECRDVKVGTTEYPTVQAAKEKLIQRAQEQFDAGIDIPDMTADVDYVDMSHILTKEEFTALTNVFLGDTVRVKYELEGLLFDARVVAYTWDCLREEYESIELGSKKASIANVQMPKYLIPDSAISGRKLDMPLRLQVNKAEDGIRTANEALTTANDALTAANAEFETARIRNFVAEVATIALAKIDEAHIDEAWIEKLTAKVVDIVLANIDTLIVNNATITWGTITNLTATIASLVAAKIGEADIDFAKIKDLITDTAIIREGVGGKLFIDRLSVSEANIVNLSVGKLMVRGDDGSFYRISVGPEGEIITTLVQVGNENIANLSLDAGEKLIKSSITADCLDVDEILGGSAFIGRIQSGHIAAGAVETGHISAGAKHDLLVEAENSITIAVGPVSNVANTAQSTANAAVAAASNAQTAANTANNALTDIASDSKLTAAEKQAAKKEWDVIAGEKAKIDSQADTYSLSKTAYGGAYTALNSYLNAAGTGILLNLATTSDISGSYFRSIFTDYYNARQDLLNAISAKAKQLADNAQGKANEAYSKFESVPGMITAEVSGPRDTAAYAKAMADAIAKMSTGNWVYQDPVFKEGLNDVSVYNNAGNGVVQLSRIAKPADCPAVSTHCLQIQHSGLAAPELGGFVQHLWSRANALFVVKYLAKLPVGYTLVKASNAMGDNWTDDFIGQAAGTGKWEEYIRVIRCGATGTFSLGGHVYVTGPTPSVGAPLVWQLGAIYAYDASETNSIPSRVSAAEFKLTPDQILLAIASRSHVVLTPEAVEILGGIIRFMSNEMDFILLKNGLEALQINADGISSSLPISSPSILSPSVLGVYRGAQSAAWSGAINASLGNIAKYIPYETYLNVPAGTYQENIIIDGYCGNMLTLFFTGNTTIEGGVIVRNCSSKIRLINNGSGTVTILHGASSGVDAPVFQVGCNLTMSGIRVTGKPRPVAGAGSGVGVHALEGATLTMSNCTVERTNGYGVLGEINCFVDLYQCRGGQAGGDHSTLQNLGIGALATRGTILNMYETCPMGATQAHGYWQAPEPVGTPTPTASAGAAPVITTRTLTYIVAFGGTVYPGSTGGWEWMSSDTFSSAWQTNNTTYGDRMPVWGLIGASGIAAAIGSGTPTAGKLKLQRGTAWGDSGAVALHLKYHNYADRAAVVAGTAKPVMVDIADVSFARGETKTIDLPAGVLAALKNGTCKGFGGSNLTPTLMMLGDVCTLEITVQGGP